MALGRLGLMLVVVVVMQGLEWWEDGDDELVWRWPWSPVCAGTGWTMGLAWMP